MAASYPNTVKSFTALNAGDVIQDTDSEVAYDEITALEQALLVSGLAHALTPDASAAARTLGSTSKFWGLSYLKGLSLADAVELTIASDAVTATQSYHRVDTQADAASDDLSTITAGSGVAAGFLLVLRAENVARVVTLKDGVGNLLLNGDYAMSSADRTITLMYDGTNWRELARSGNIQALTADTTCPAGGGSETFKLAGVIDFDDTQAALASGTEAVLRTQTIPANTLNADGRQVVFRAWGTLAADTDNKILRVRYDNTAGTVLAQVSQNSATLTRWEVEVRIIRLAADSQRVITKAQFFTAPGSGAAPSSTMAITTSAKADTGAIVLVLTAEGVNANDVVYETSLTEVTN